MAIARHAWVLNLDADLELAAPRSYSPSKGVIQAMRLHREALRQSLMRPDDVLIDETTPANAAKGLVGRAFCPTPRALALLIKAGAVLSPTPEVGVLARVNSRGFLAQLGQTLPHAAFCTQLQSALDHLKRDPEIGDHWRIKRSFGMAGRGQRIVSPGEPDAATVGALRAGMRAGGVQIEPNVTIVREVAIHAMLSMEGELRMGQLVAQQCDRNGAWLSTEPASHEALAHTMVEEARRVGAALRANGYWGPFGIDAYEYRDKHGEGHFQPRSELNARYSMGFAVGFRMD